MGRLHRGQGGHVPAHRQQVVALDDDQEQRQEARQDQRDARVLTRFDYDGKDADVVGTPDPLIVQRGKKAVGD